MQKFIMLCGVAASGKSSLAEELAKEERNQCNDCVVLSSDKFRLEYLGSEEDQSRNGFIFDQMNRRLHEDADYVQTIIYDATNLSMKRRKSLLDGLKKYKCRKEIYVVLARPAELYARDERRSRTVGRQVIDKQIKQFQCPQYFEGWDEIKFVYNGLWFDSISWMQRLLNDCDEPHDNPHHSYSILDHMKLSRDIAVQKYPEDLELHFASLYHDVGKPFCKTWYNFHGYKDDVAHYYGHQNAGAYLMLFCWVPFFEQPEKIRNLPYVIGLINYHMEPYIRKDAYEKFAQVLDERLARGIEKIHECDRLAH